MFIFPALLACVAFLASAQGAAVGQIVDVAFEFEGQPFHLTPLEKRQAAPAPNASPAPTQEPDEVGGKLGGGDHRPKCQTVDLPASLKLKVCGCRNPGCPHCPCNNNEGSDWDDSDDKKKDDKKKDDKKNPKKTNAKV